ncbi:MAG: hypothetical protein HY913_13820 [Desulfomonile tiedjei]|nr:hypothetical protein [Desulfomonile tiedjei]
MRIPLMLVIGLMILIQVMFGVACADPVKWSAPMNHYPSQWSPTAAPPSYPYAAYGYGPYGAYPGYGYGPYGGYGGYYQGQYPGTQQGGFSGNPYQQQYYYGQ